MAKHNFGHLTFMVSQNVLSTNAALSPKNKFGIRVLEFQYAQKNFIILDAICMYKKFDASCSSQNNVRASVICSQSKINAESFGSNCSPSVFLFKVFFSKNRFIFIGCFFQKPYIVKFFKKVKQKAKRMCCSNLPNARQMRNHLAMHLFCAYWAPNFISDTCECNLNTLNFITN